MPVQRCADGVWREIAQQAQEFVDPRATGYQIVEIAACLERRHESAARKARRWQDLVPDSLVPE